MSQLNRIAIRVVAGVMVVGCLSACSTWEKLDQKEQGAVIGTGSGATLGGVVGGTKGAVIGGVAGGVAGGVIGHQMDKDDEGKE